MDIVDALLGEHGALYAQFDHVEGTISQLSLDALKAQNEVLAAALQSHSSLEDELLFTALERILGGGASGSGIVKNWPTTTIFCTNSSATPRLAS